MRFVIVGYGRVGRRTARILGEEGHDVTVVDEDPDVVGRIEQHGFEAVEGDGASEAVLDRCDLDAAGGLAGLTGDLNVNFAACLVAKAHGCRTVMRIGDDYGREVYRKYADDVDEVLYPERLGAASAKTALLGGDFHVVADLAEELALTAIRIPSDSPALGERLYGIDLGTDARIYAHGHDHEPMTIPMPGTVLEANDRVAVIADHATLTDVRRTLLGE